MVGNGRSVLLTAVAVVAHDGAVIGRLVDRVTGAEQLEPSRGAEMRATSEDYWRASTDTYLGSSVYYDRRAAVLEDVLTRIPTGPAVDVGCGDGRFTRQIATHFTPTVGLDIGPALISAARAAAVHERSSATFQVATVDDPLPGDQALVAALGVTSCIVDDEGFHGFLAACAGACRPGGSLVLVDSLSRSEDALTRFRSGYVARYRDVPSYSAAVEATGFTLVEEHDLGKPAEGIMAKVPGRRMNRLYWFRR